MLNDPIQVHVTRGGITESQHDISAVVINSHGNVLEQWGDVDKPVYPRSAIKALQALPMVERGGVERFGFSESELALCCASHNGETEHVNTAQSMLDKVSCSEANYECGKQWPMRVEAGYALAAAGQLPDQRHNNCSGKHAGMLALAQLLGVDSAGYIAADHPVQHTIRETFEQMCDVDLSRAPVSPDGCSAPTWAMPLTALALGFARFADPQSLPPERAQACRALYQAVIHHPFMVAGTERYCTEMMTVLGDRAFLKVGAEGVYIAAIPGQNIAIALKCEDGAKRGAERVMTELLDRYGVTKGLSDAEMAPFRTPEIRNWNGLLTGVIRCDIVEL
ncbi:asparaginase [Reinekea blandensis]|uniref:L-asparaginase II n=1 Tax=Reinekea blandensis MED297 TaxID=314283 RepID=A4B9P4_9GAMM|nr:asparaginase [Reinekea blandensis]EAR11345.1 hypothetical protein MED297_20697 [Reinekea sp. MED297] [Reinekea blandensis MED297]